MVKSYLRYVPGGVHGVVASPSATIAADASGTFVFTPQLEGVGLWNVKKGVQVTSLAPAPAPPAYDGTPDVTCVAVCGPTSGGAAPRLVAAGYADGTVRVFDYGKGACVQVLNGHRKAVSTLAFSPDGLLLASGSRDTDIILWDVVAEVGLARLRGHRDEVTGLAFLPAGGEGGGSAAARTLAAGVGAGVTGGSAGARAFLLVTCSKDTTVRVWDLATYTCLQSVLGARVEQWSLAVSASAGAEGAVAPRIVVGGGDNLLRVFGVHADWRARAASASTGGAAPMADVDDDDGEAAGGAGDGRRGAATVGAAVAAAAPPVGSFEVIHSLGTLVRQTHERSATVAASGDGGSLIAVQAAGKIAEVWRRRGDEEVRRRVLRRLRRTREKVRARDRAVAAAASGASSAVLKSAWEVGADAGAGDSDGDEDVDGADGDGGAGAGAGWMMGTSLAALESEIAAMEAAERSGALSEGVGGHVARAAVAARDEWELVGVLSASVKLSSLAFLPVDHTAGTASLVVSTSDNQLLVYALPLTAAARERAGGATTTTAAGITVSQAALTRTLAQQGHRSDVRSVALSSDGALMLTTSAGQAKVWTTKTGACIRTLDLGDTMGLCCAFGPGNRHSVVGCKDGRVLVHDLSSGDLVQEHADAHEGAVWSAAVRPDGRGMATGSADKTVKFWDFVVVGGATAAAGAGGGGGGKPSGGGAAQLALVHARTLKIGDEVMCVRYSHHTVPSEVLIAVALLDSTVKVFFEDTLKFFLSLYGHKLPVLAMDISADNTLLVTASADKNVKLWGLDYGDCHRSLHAHGDAVTAVAFLSRTHYFFTASKDRTVKYWDADRFEHILTLQGHHKGEVWGLATAPDGTFLATGSHDRSIRLWRRSEEQVFLDEERERETMAAVERNLRDPDGDDVVDGVGDAVGPVDAATGMAKPTELEAPVTAAPLVGTALADASLVVARATADSSKGVDRVVEALALAREEAAKWREYADDVAAAVAAGDEPTVVDAPARNPLLLDLTPAAFLLRTLRTIRPSDLDQVLIVLPFADALDVLRYMHHMLRRRVGVELCARVVLLLLRVHQHTLATTHALQPMLTSLQATLTGAIGVHRDRIGYNAAGLRYLDKLATREMAADAALAGDASAGATVETTTVRVGKRAAVAIF